MNENNFNKDYNTSVTKTTTDFNNSYCIYKLACGYCKILEKVCPMYCYNGRICDSPYLNQVTRGLNE